MALPNDLNYRPTIGQEGVIAGFGLRQDPVRGWTLNFLKQTGVVRVMHRDYCKLRLEHRQELISPTHFCTDNSPSICFGHIGNGLTVEIDKVETLVGVVSVITNMCYPRYPVMFTEVGLYLDWIRENIQL